ncbi:hypothetical protein, partial [Bacillus cereus]|uniref:hypothetical protein n=1 Tax=Bacillus cereus TaxID=1396 RepID=UPI000C005763
NKKGVNIPLFVAILGLVALAFIILLVIIHSLSPAETAGASKVTRSFVSSTSCQLTKQKVLHQQQQMIFQNGKEVLFLSFKIGRCSS